ncbi:MULTISPECIES: hypothetical protein [Clostridium]|uniref:hypothetical protein n=1 Tax=Clostridium TaxID=1485 RepID=UPI000E03968A|nr:hypothetical protein [Clostridium sporogenes]MCW6087216.1 hypothetical protein [Clostridium sporogenes]MCW6107749.1 hypothetical protein [Clostridium sporogenes]STC72642.1 Uncharacterised protein [Clostridium botulinum]
MEIIKSSTFQSSVASSVCILWNACGCVLDCSSYNSCSTQQSCPGWYIGCPTNNF